MRPRIRAACDRVKHTLPEEEVARLKKTYGLTDPKQEARLLDAVVSAPDDDAPRLVYADWLMEQGDPRGELIALMIAGERPEQRRGAVEEARERVGSDRSPPWRRRSSGRGASRSPRRSVRSGAADAAKSIGDPRWRTFERLTHVPDMVNLLPLLTDAAFANLVSLEWMAAKNARHLLQVPRELPLRRLGLMYDAGPVKRLTKTIVEATSVPNLEIISLLVWFGADHALGWYRALCERLGRAITLEIVLHQQWRIRIDPTPKILAVEKITEDAHGSRCCSAP